MNLLIKNIYLIFIAYYGYGYYEMYNTHLENVESKQAEKIQIESKLEKAQKQKKEFNKYAKQVDQIKASIERVAQEIEKMQQQLPNEFEDTTNLENFSSLARRINMKEVYLTPMQEQDKGFYFTKEYELKASGTYLQFLVFVEQLSNLKRIFNIRGINLKLKEMNQKSRYQVVSGVLTIESYKYNTNYKEDRGIDNIEKEASKTPEVVSPRKSLRGKKNAGGDGAEGD
jgi:Tfp pilus assembly protein PilO